MAARGGSGHANWRSGRVGTIRPVLCSAAGHARVCGASPPRSRPSPKHCRRHAVSQHVAKGAGVVPRHRRYNRQVLVRVRAGAVLLCKPVQLFCAVAQTYTIRLYRSAQSSPASLSNTCERSSGRRQSRRPPRSLGRARSISRAGRQPIRFAFVNGCPRRAGLGARCQRMLPCNRHS